MDAHMQHERSEQDAPTNAHQPGDEPRRRRLRRTPRHGAAIPFEPLDAGTAAAAHEQTPTLRVWHREKETNHRVLLGI